MAIIPEDKEELARESDCSCFIIDESEPISPENLLCHVEGGMGYLSDGQEKEYCFGEKWNEFKGKIEDMGKKEVNEAMLETNYVTLEPKTKGGKKVAVGATPPGYERQINRMKYEVGPTWGVCFEKEESEDFWECVNKRSEEALGLWKNTVDELRDMASDKGITGYSRMNKTELIQRILASES